MFKMEMGGKKTNFCCNQNTHFPPLDFDLPTSSPCQIYWDFHTKFCLQTDLCCMSPAVPWINVSQRLCLPDCFPTPQKRRRKAEKKEEGRKQEKTICGLWKPGDWATQQITSRQSGMESEQYLWKKKEPVRKEQASSVRGGNCAIGKLIQEESPQLEKAE